MYKNLQNEHICKKKRLIEKQKARGDKECLRSMGRLQKEVMKYSKWVVVKGRGN